MRSDTSKEMDIAAVLERSASVPGPDAAADVFTALQVLTASIAHEVKQPLAGILTNAGTCLRMLGEDPPNVHGVRETVQRMIRDVNRAAEVIDRMRALLSGGTTHHEFVDLNETVLRILASCRNELERTRISVHSRLAGDAPVLLGDPVQVEQVVSNLVRNAIEAMHETHRCPRELTITTWQDRHGPPIGISPGWGEVIRPREWQQPKRRRASRASPHR